MRYLVTGATGFVGGHLVRHLAERGEQITALVRDGRRVPGARLAPGDLLTGEGLTDALRDVDRVIHLAGVTKSADPRAYTAVNTDGTRRLRDAVAGLPVPPRLVYCSSLAASGPGRRRRAEEPPAPVSLYGRSKLGGELALDEAADQVNAVTVRPPIVYGPGDREFLPRLVGAVRSGLLPAVGRPGPRHYCLVHVDDLCRALIAAADPATAPGTHHVCDGTEHRWDDIGAAVAAVLRRRAPRVVHIPAPLAAAAARLAGRSSMLNPDKVAEARHPAWTCAPSETLPFGPATPLAEGLRASLTG